MPNGLFILLCCVAALKFFGAVGYLIYCRGYDAGYRDSHEVGQQLQDLLHDPPPASPHDPACSSHTS